MARDAPSGPRINTFPLEDEMEHHLRRPGEAKTPTFAQLTKGESLDMDGKVAQQFIKQHGYPLGRPLLIIPPIKKNSESQRLILPRFGALSQKSAPGTFQEKLRLKRNYVSREITSPDSLIVKIIAPRQWRRLDDPARISSSSTPDQTIKHASWRT